MGRLTIKKIDPIAVEIIIGFESISLPKIQATICPMLSNVYPAVHKAKNIPTDWKDGLRKYGIISFIKGTKTMKIQVKIRKNPEMDLLKYSLLSSSFDSLEKAISCQAKIIPFETIGIDLAKSIDMEKIPFADEFKRLLILILA